MSRPGYQVWGGLRTDGPEGPRRPTYAVYTGLPGAAGATGATGATGAAGPNSVSDSTAIGSLTTEGSPAYLLGMNAAGTFARKIDPASLGGGGGGGAPTNAQYVTLATNATLTNERVLTAGTGITITDGGAGSTITVGVTASTYQPLDAELTALAGVTSAADKLFYFTGSGTGTVTDLTSFARTILDDANAAAVRSTIGAGTGSGDAVLAATQTFSGVNTFSQPITVGPSSYLDFGTFTDGTARQQFLWKAVHAETGATVRSVLNNTLFGGRDDLTFTAWEFNGDADGRTNPNLYAVNGGQVELTYQPSAGVYQVEVFNLKYNVGASGDPSAVRADAATLENCNDADWYTIRHFKFHLHEFDCFNPNVTGSAQVTQKRQHSLAWDFCRYFDSHYTLGLDSGATTLTVGYDLPLTIQSSGYATNLLLNGALILNGTAVTFVSAVDTVNFRDKLTDKTGTGAAVFANNPTFPNNVTIDGDLTVSGATITANVASYTVEDPLIQLGSGNAGDAVDEGWYASYTASGVKYRGSFWDASSSVFRLFTGLEEAPTTTVNISGTGYTVATLVANLTGNVTGNLTGSSGSCTGNAATATALQTARAINGTNFDGTGNITITAAAGTLTGTTLNATVVTTSITSTGTLTGGATGAGFTLALSTSTLTGTLPAAQMPALTGDVTTSAGAVATTIATDAVTTAKILNANVTPAKLSTAAKTKQITVTIGDGVSVPTANTQCEVVVPFAGTITKATLLADASGSAVIDVWKDTYANYPPTVGDTITASAKPTLSTAIKSQDSTLTGWTTSVSAGDILKFNLDSVTTCKRLVLALELTLS